MELTELNVLAIIAATTAAFGVGAVWYSPALFAGMWSEDLGFNAEGVETAADPRSGNAFAISFFCLLLAAFVLALIFQALQISGAASGAIVGLMAAFGFVATSIGSDFLIESKPPRLLMITLGHHITSFLVMGSILGASM